jgi:hypothetical protein
MDASKNRAISNIDGCTFSHTYGVLRFIDGVVYRAEAFLEKSYMERSGNSIW